MAAAVAEFFEIIGPDVTPPTCMVELIPYLLTIFVGIFLVTSVFRLIGAIASVLINWRKF